MRRGRFLGGVAIVLAAGMMSVPYALAETGSAVDQGYPCATQPPSTPGGTTGGTTGSENCTTTTTTTTTVTTPAAPAPVAQVAPAQTQQVAGANHTVKKAAAPPATASNVAPASAGTLPFTRIQLGVFVVIGLLLIGGGLVLRASGRHSNV